MMQNVSRSTRLGVNFSAGFEEKMEHSACKMDSPNI